MMDEDFDQLGKRLYDLEGDPPKDGWDKLGAALLIKQSTGRLQFLRKNWWKPLVLIIPALIYFLLPENSQIPEQQKSLDELTTNERLLSTDQKAGKDNNLNEDTLKHIDPINGTRQAPPFTTYQKAEANIDNQQINSNKYQKNSSTLSIKKSVVAFAKQEENHLTSDKLYENKIDKTSVIQTEDNESRSLNTLNERENLIVKEVTEQKEQQDTAGSELKQPISKEAEKDEILLVKNSEESKAPEHQYPAKDKDRIATDGQLMFTSNHSLMIEKDISLQQDTIASTVTHREVEKETEGNKEEEKKNLPWRWSVTIAPQFIPTNNTPLTNDEIFVTGIEKNKYPQKAGWNLGLGLGKAISKNLYLDGHLTFTHIKQATKLSFTNGTIDTLLALRQADQSIRVVPVYSINKKEVESNYNLAGIRLQSTYYFHKGPFKRFNINADAGAHFLINSKLREKIDTEWTTLENTAVNRVNYTLTLGAGYHFAFAPGWELLINPTLTYYLKMIDSNSLPYQLNQKALGLNFMLSKSISKKR